MYVNVFFSTNYKNRVEEQKSYSILIFFKFTYSRQKPRTYDCTQHSEEKTKILAKSGTNEDLSKIPHVIVQKKELLMSFTLQF
jgi:hypothetical protein